MAEQNIHAIGRRKEAVCRVFLRPGSGKWDVNGRTLGDYFPRPTLVTAIQQPFAVTDTLGRFDVLEYPGILFWIPSGATDGASNGKVYSIIVSAIAAQVTAPGQPTAPAQPQPAPPAQPTPTAPPPPPVPERGTDTGN